MQIPQTLSRNDFALVMNCLIVAAVGAEYTVTAEPDFTPPPLAVTAPDMSRFQSADVRKNVPDNRNGSVRIGLASEVPLLEESFRGQRGRDLRERQATDAPKVIVLEKGPLSLDRVVAALADPQVAENRAGVILLRLPFFIAPGASLIVDGTSTASLRLSTNRGAFVANAGQLFVVDATITSWNESTSQPSLFVDKQQFRPFVTSYVRSRTYLAGSKFEHLGFAAPSAYGLSLTSHPERNRGEPREDWPTGILVDNEFRGCYYGFYSFEARDVGIVDNLYIDNIMYGIDPHDRSTRLVIAGNRATATRERHGIIGSRGISHSFILDNESDHNAQSGIMLDRQCSTNVIRGNKVHQNGQGIAIYESPDNLVCDNLVAFNTKSGVRVRNSRGIDVRDNTIVGQGDYALEISAKRLDDHDQRMARGDTYDARVEVSFFGNLVRGNKGLAKAMQFGVLRLADIRQDADVPALAAQFELPYPTAPDSDDADFGQELKPLTDRLNRVFQDAQLLLTIRGPQE